MNDATNTVFNKEARQRAIQVSPEKIVDLLSKSMAQGDNGETPRNFADYLVSLSLEEETTLPLYPLNKKDSLEAFQNDFEQVKEENRVDKVIVFDTETTGYNGYAVSMAFILYSIKENKILKKYYSLVNPQVDIPADSTEIHKIKNEDVQDEKTFAELWPEIQEMFNEADMAVGQNLGFDFRVLEREFDRMGIPNPIEAFFWFDTMTLAKQIVKARDKNGKRIKDPKLEESVEFFGIKLEDTEYHNALVDTEATLEVFKAMLAYKE